MERLEQINENIKNTIEELQEVKRFLKSTKQIDKLDSIISNLDIFNDEIYQVFEQYQGYNEEFKDIKHDNEIIVELLKNLLSFSDKVYYEQKYKIYLD